MIISKTPLRVSFFGGGTDLPSFTEKEFGCVISTSIDKYIYLVAHKSFDNKNIISYSKTEITEKIDDIQNTRVREVLKKLGVKKGIEMHSIGEVPSGTGLGSSSSFTVGLLNVVYAHLGKFVGKKELAEQASEVEITRLKEPIGKQDQYAAAFGGFNFIKFNKDGTVSIEPLRTRPDIISKLNNRLIAFYLNKTRDASVVLTEQNKSVSSSKDKLKAMIQMRDLTLEMKEELDNNKITRFGKMLHEGWMIKKSMASGISNEWIDEIYERGLKAGAEGGKVLGAGGGGFILFYCEPEKQAAVRKALSDLKEFKFKFEREGARIIYSQ